MTACYKGRHRTKSIKRTTRTLSILPCHPRTSASGSMRCTPSMSSGASGPVSAAVAAMAVKIICKGILPTRRSGLATYAGAFISDAFGGDRIFTRALIKKAPAGDFRAVLLETWSVASPRGDHKLARSFASS